MSPEGAGCAPAPAVSHSIVRGRASTGHSSSNPRPAPEKRSLKKKSHCHKGFKEPK